MKQTKLRGFLLERNITIRELAKISGIKEVTLYKKVGGKGDFTYTEVHKICKALGIENPVEVFTANE